MNDDDWYPIKAKIRYFQKNPNVKNTVWSQRAINMDKTK